MNTLAYNTCIIPRFKREFQTTAINLLQTSLSDNISTYGRCLKVRGQNLHADSCRAFGQMVVWIFIKI